VNCRSAPWVRVFTSTAPARSTVQASVCLQLPSPILTKKKQSLRRRVILRLAVSCLSPGVWMWVCLCADFMLKSVIWNSLCLAPTLSWSTYIWGRFTPESVELRHIKVGAVRWRYGCLSSRILTRTFQESTGRPYERVIRAVLCSWVQELKKGPGGKRMPGSLLYVEYKDIYGLIYDKDAISDVITITRIERLPNLPRGSWERNSKLTKNFKNLNCVTKCTTHWACWCYAVANAILLAADWDDIWRLNHSMLCSGRFGVRLSLIDLILIWKSNDCQNQKIGADGKPLFGAVIPENIWNPSMNRVNLGLSAVSEYMWSCWDWPGAIKFRFHSNRAQITSTSPAWKVGKPSFQAI